MTLSEQQHKRLEKLPPEARVIGEDRGDPLIRQNGRVVRLKVDGRVHAAKLDVVDRVTCWKRIDRVFPRVSCENQEGQ